MEQSFAVKNIYVGLISYVDIKAGCLELIFVCFALRFCTLLTI
jgi:hypothetical protein